MDARFPETNGTFFKRRHFVAELVTRVPFGPARAGRPPPIRSQEEVEMTALSTIPQLPMLSQEGGLSAYMAAIRKFPMLSAEQEALYARRWREAGDREAAYHLVTAHLRLAAKIALNYRGYGLPLADLISEANLGLMLAVKKFKPDKGFRLSTYARWWIKAMVQEYVLRSWSLVKIGTTSAQKKLFFNLRRLKRRLSGHTADDLSPEQVTHIAEALKVKPRDVIEMDARMRGDVSLNVPTNHRESAEDMQDRLVDPSADPEQLLAEAEDRRQLHASLEAALAGLNSRERRIVEARYLTQRPATLEELGRAFNVSRERIRQIEVRALQKLQVALTARRGRMSAAGRARPSLRQRASAQRSGVDAPALAA
jgi:RNA polymerase sigma-32 factor